MVKFFLPVYEASTYLFIYVKVYSDIILSIAVAFPIPLLNPG
jgi:hypothetical protein